MPNLPIPNSRQLLLDFCAPKTSHSHWEEVANNIERSLVQKRRYFYESKIQLNWNDYTMTIWGNHCKQSAIVYKENGDVSQIIFALRWASEKFQFEIGIEEYAISSININNEPKKYMSKLKIDYIKKIDNNKWWKKYRMRNGEKIMTFNYFRYLFWCDIHNTVLEELVSVILKIDAEKK